MIFCMLSLGYPLWYISLCLLCGILYSSFFYFKFKFDHPKEKWIKLILIFLRTVAVSLICFLLLLPVLDHWINKVETPKIIIGIDQSQSIGHALRGKENEFIKKVEVLSSELRKKFDVEIWGIGNSTYPKLTKGFNQNFSNLNSYFELVNEKQYSEHISSMLLISDGIFNKGPNPLFEALKTKKTVYTVGLGDSLPTRDLQIKNVLFNEVAFLNDIVKINVDVKAFNFKDQNATITLIGIDGNKSKILNTKKIAINQNDYFQTVNFDVKLSKIGFQHFKVLINKTNGETTYENNASEFFIHVLDSRIKIQILGAAPHPDIATLKSILNESKNYFVESAYLFEAPILDKSADLYILHNIPSLNSFQSTGLSLMDQIKNSKKAVFYFVGPQTSVSKLNQYQDLVLISQTLNTTNDVYAHVNTNFNNFSLSENWASEISRFPPLQSIFGSYQNKSQSQSLLYQKIGQLNTDYPLLLFGQKNQQKTAIFTGEGIWRWKLYESKVNIKKSVLKDLMASTLRYLTTREDKRKLRVKTEKSIFDESEEITLFGELYNSNYELNNDPEIRIQINNGKGQNYEYILDRNNKSYKLPIGSLNPGIYQFKAKTSFQKQKLEADGSFIVNATKREMSELQMDKGLLSQLAEQSGGEYLAYNQWDKLLNKIISNPNLKPEVITIRKSDPLINLKWIFALIFCMLSIEWVLRRWMGKY